MSDRRQYMAKYYQLRKSSDPNYLQRHKEANRRSIERKALALAEQLTKASSWELHEGYTAAARGPPFDTRQTADWRQGWRIWTRLHKRAA